MIDETVTISRAEYDEYQELLRLTKGYLGLNEKDLDKLVHHMGGEAEFDNYGQVIIYTGCTIKDGTLVEFDY